MANNDQSEEPKQNEEPVEEQVDGLTAEEAAGVRPYDEVEVWKKSKNTLFFCSWYHCPGGCNLFFL